jgi:heptosyltransferase-2
MRFPRILIKAPNWLGDAVMAGPFIGALRSHWGKGHIAVLAREKVRPVIERMEGIDEIIAERATPWGIASSLDGGDFDMFFSLSSSVRPVIAAALLRIPERVGFSGGGRKLFLTRSIPPMPRSIHVARHYLALASLEGVPSPGKISTSLKILPRDLKEAGKFIARAGVKKGEALLAFAPGAAYGPAKRWFDASWAELADLLAREPGIRVVITGGREELARASAIASLAARPVIDATGKLSIGGTMALLSLCRGFVSNDSGLMHLGGAVGAPTLGLFGSSNPCWTAPLGRKTGFLWGRVACSPCYRRTCLPGRDYACLKAITTGKVLKAVKRLNKRA